MTHSAFTKEDAENNSATGNMLHELAFDNTVQANLIFQVSNGKIVAANKAACMLLGYSKKELLTKEWSSIFDVKERSLKVLMKQRQNGGQAAALVTIFRKKGKPLLCQVTSAVFMDEDGTEKSITSITDMRQSIRAQKNIDAIKEKKVAYDILLAKSDQKRIDGKKEKLVAQNILLAKSVQKTIDIKKDKIVAHNIAMVQSNQKKIDAKKEQTVAENIKVAEEKTDALLADSNEWIKSISQASYDVMWDWDIATGQIYAGDSVEEVLGYKVRNNTLKFSDFIACIAPGGKKLFEKRLWNILAGGNKSWDDSFVLKHKNGSRAMVAARANIVRNEKGEAVLLIGVLKDVTGLRKLQEGVKTSKDSIDLLTQGILKQKERDVKTNMLLDESSRLEKAKYEGRLEERKEIFLMASKLSSYVIWDWNLLTNELFRGEGLEELFGQPLKDAAGLVSDWTDRIHPDEKEAVEKSIQDAIASGSVHWERAFRLIRADGSVANVFDRASIIRDTQGKAIRIIGAMQDLSVQKELEEKLNYEIELQKSLLTEYEKNFKLIFNSSSDVLYDSDLINHEVIISDAYEKVYGYKIVKNMTPAADWLSHIHPGDKETVFSDYQRMLESKDDEWKYGYRFLRADGSVAHVFSNAIVFRNAEGKAVRMIGSMQDISKLTQLEEKLQLEFASKIKDKENFRQLFDSSSDVLFDVDVNTDEVIFSSAYEKQFGYKITPRMTPEKDWACHIHPDDRKAILKGYRKRILSADTQWSYQYRFIRSDGSLVNILSTGVVIRNDRGKVTHLFGVMHDISKKSQLEEKLEQEIKLKEKQIADARDEAKEYERSNLGRELHDNVNQLLGASKMYVDMAKRGGPDSESYLSRASEYTLSAIEEIRKLTKGLATDYIKNLGLCEAINSLSSDTMEVSPLKISCALDEFIENRVNDKFKLNMYRIVQEQLNNILKHAKATEVTISLSQNKKIILLSIADNGVGFDISKKRKGIGVANIKSRAATYKGSADFESEPGRGCVLTATFPVTDVLLNKG